VTFAFTQWERFLNRFRGNGGTVYAGPGYSHAFERTEYRFRLGAGGLGWMERVEGGGGRGSWGEIRTVPEGSLPVCDFGELLVGSAVGAGEFGAGAE